MRKILKEFHSPGVLWVILFSGIIYLAHLYFSDLILSILIALILVSLVAKLFSPEHARIRELTIIAKTLNNKPLAPPDLPDSSSAPNVTEPNQIPVPPISDAEIDEVAEGSFFGKVLWG